MFGHLEFGHPNEVKFSKIYYFKIVIGFKLKEDTIHNLSQFIQLLICDCATQTYENLRIKDKL